MNERPKKYRRRPKALLSFTSSIPWKGRKKGQPMMVGYVRVSMSHQNTQRQVDELVRFGVSPIDIFGDKASGKNLNRPGWKACIKSLEPGDILVIHSLDRMSRSVIDTMMSLQMFIDKGVQLKILTMDFDSQTPLGRYMLANMASFAQFERETSNARAAHGLQTARERGVVGGRTTQWSKEQVQAAYAKYGTYEKTAEKLGCSRITVIRKVAPAYVRKAEEAKFQKDLARKEMESI